MGGTEATEHVEKSIRTANTGAHGGVKNAQRRTIPDRGGLPKPCSRAFQPINHPGLISSECPELNRIIREKDMTTTTAIPGRATMPGLPQGRPHTTVRAGRSRPRRTNVGTVATAVCIVALLTAGCSPRHRMQASNSQEPSSKRGPALIVFAGAASQPATSEVTALYGKETGVPVECTFGGSGAVLNQIRMEHYGDVYLPGSNDYMDIAEKDGLVIPETRRIICWLTPSICVAPGNPLGIRGVKDLVRPGMRLTIGDPGSVCLGRIAVDAFNRAGIYEKVRPNIVTFASDCRQVVNLVRLGEVDAAIGYDVFQRQSPKQIVAIPIEGSKQLNVPAATVAYSKQPEQALRLIEFFAGPKGKEVFRKHGYAVDAK